MKIANRGRFALALLLLSLWLPAAWAGHAVLIWPVDPVMAGAQKAAELWVENKGATATLLQVRIFAWQQSGEGERFHTQQDIIASPPMLRLDAGQKQLIRLIRQTPAAAGREQAYRILLDEIPTPGDRVDDPANSLTFQMRYSIPLFVYAGQASPDSGAPLLSWRLVQVKGQTCLEIANRGPVHARLSRARLGTYQLTDGLFGYVLANSSYRWPLKAPVDAGSLLEARVDNRKTVWRSRAAAR
ncbi:fimbrial biogenesis chaperone [Acerihabitans arboris]|uniref:Fimbria/pilus periplasmic chaperone n=1 Tax=Acerihabitans arboris TaxID=2691583 RepID=A0A845SN71_9GAMM|nr:molecular chaperone [Acerihabitans arboris]NDL64657.1 fimbria/pilus periplasmic chaperone [Acerihabitans arboris]